MSRSGRPFQRLGGFTLVEVSFALIIVAFLSFFAIQQTILEAKYSLGSAQAEQLQYLQTRVNAYLRRFPAEVSANYETATTTFKPDGASASIKYLEIPLSTLVNKGLLAADYSSKPVAIKSAGNDLFRVFVTRESGFFQGYVLLDSPLVDNGGVNVDDKVLAAYIRKAGSLGFATLSTNAYPKPPALSGTQVLYGKQPAQVPVGLVGILVGSGDQFGSTFNNLSPVPEYDFCIGNALKTWEEAGKTCGTYIFNDTPVGYRFVVNDDNGPSSDKTAFDEETTGPGNSKSTVSKPTIGAAYVRCVYHENEVPPARLEILSSCCSTGSTGCTPPVPSE